VHRHNAEHVQFPLYRRYVRVIPIWDASRMLVNGSTRNPARRREPTDGKPNRDSPVAALC